MIGTTEHAMIRQDTDYALRMLAHLAEAPRRGIPSSGLSNRLDVPHGFAQKILRRLAAAGILASTPGRSGGFRLARRPGEVSLMDVIVAIQGPPLLNRCMGRRGACSRQRGCRISASLRVFQDKLDAFLGATTLPDVMGKSSGRPRRRRTHGDF